jgi:hypothetical protein
MRRLRRARAQPHSGPTRADHRACLAATPDQVLAVALQIISEREAAWDTNQTTKYMEKNPDTETPTRIQQAREHLLFHFRVLRCDDDLETVIRANLGFSVDKLAAMALERAGNRLHWGNPSLDSLVYTALQIITEVHAAQPNAVLEQLLRSMEDEQNERNVGDRVVELQCVPFFIESLLREIIDHLLDGGTQAEAYSFLELLAYSDCADKETWEQHTTDSRLLLAEWVKTGTLSGTTSPEMSQVRSWLGT